MAADQNSVFSKIKRYPTLDTYNFADNLLPSVLNGKTKDQIKEYLTGETTEENTLRLMLNNFGIASRKARYSWENGLTYCYYNIPWKIDDSKYKQVNQQNMMLLNLLLFTKDIRIKYNSFIYSVLISIELTNKLPFKKQMNSEGRIFCIPCNLKNYWKPIDNKNTVPGRYYPPYY